MKKAAIRLVAAAAIAGLGLGVAACGASKRTGAPSPSSRSQSPSPTTADGGLARPASVGTAVGGSVGVILPDTESSARWQLADKPALAKAFAAAGIRADIQNALGDKKKFQTIAQGMIQQKVDVLVLVPLDSPSAAIVEQQASGAGIKVIDYDRLVLGGSAAFYASYDGIAVGKEQGQCLADAMTKIGKPAGQIISIDGPPTDNNATVFAQGLRSVLDTTQLKNVAEQAIPDWNNKEAGTAFRQLLTANGNKVDGVYVMNDGMAQSVVSVLKKSGLNGKVPVTGQDATPAGLQRILAGDQTCTVYKDATNEADAVVKLASDIIEGKDGRADAPQTSHDPTGNRDVPSILLEPELITKNNVGDPIRSGAVKYSDVCTGAFTAMCTAAGISAP